MPRHSISKGGEHIKSYGGGLYILFKHSCNRNTLCSCRNGSESGFGPEGCGFESHRALCDFFHLF